MLTEPESLFNLCIVFCLKNKGLCSTNLCLPAIINEKILQVASSFGEFDNSLLKYFNNRFLMPIVHLDISCARNVQPLDLYSLKDYAFTNVNISRCTLLQVRHLNSIFSSSVRKLNFFNCSHVILREADDSMFLLQCENLQHLNLSFTNISFKLLQKILSNCRNLVSLDISGISNVGDLRELLPMKNSLQQLIMCFAFKGNLQNSEETFATICQLSQLRHLDISCLTIESDTRYSYDDPNLLHKICKSLSKLVSLDVSGTTLCDDSRNYRAANEKLPESQLPTAVNTDIRGLMCLQRPLDFLGLFATTACNFAFIPAIEVSGLANEMQLLQSFKRYQARQEYMRECLQHAYTLLQLDNISQPLDLLDLILKIMGLYSKDEFIQISGSASLHQLTLKKMYNMLSTINKRMVVTTVLNALEEFRSKQNIQRNCYLVLFNLNIPHDMEFCYKRLICHLCSILGSSSNNTTQQMAVLLINALMSQVDGSYKRLAAKQGILNKTVQIIENRVSRMYQDEILVIAWSALWNVTDETAENCESFINLKGTHLFMQCTRLFPENRELMRNMLGCLGNVAEVKSLRKYISGNQFIDTFLKLLTFDIENCLEVSYNACGILAHTMSDGEECWLADKCDRDMVREKMVEAINSWSLDTHRNITYRSFGPILILLSTELEDEVKLWAVWALANLCTVYPNKYCDMLKRENGINILNDVLVSTQHSDVIRLSNKLLDILRADELDNNFDTVSMDSFNNAMEI